MYLLVGSAMLAVGLVLLFIGLPKKGVHPRFLQFNAALVLYPPLVLALFALGAAAVIASLLGISQ